MKCPDCDVELFRYSLGEPNCCWETKIEGLKCPKCFELWQEWEIEIELEISRKELACNVPT